MSGLAFFDTNVLMYADDASSPGKQGRSFWDALIVHAARSAGAAVLYSEDLQPGAVLGGVRVVNPFVR